MQKHHVTEQGFNSSGVTIFEILQYFLGITVTEIVGGSGGNHKEFKEIKKSHHCGVGVPNISQY